MKLLQLLAKELKEWPESAKYITQEDDDGSVTLWYRAKPKYKSGEWVLDRHLDDSDYAYILHGIYTASDNKTSIVTQDQWQAEREKMNKPKWIRHRGGWMPVGGATIVEVRLRCGEIQKHEACEFLWRHKDCYSAVNIMAYRIIEETKDQEIEEVKKTNFGTITYKLEIDATEATKEIDSLAEKWGQIESPLKWRDEIIELEAYEEEFRREREKLIRKLESEGFKLIDHVTPVYGEQIIDMSDWRNWKAGDIVLILNDPDIKDGEYKITRTEEYDYDGDLPIQTSDGWADFSEATVKFIRRP